jgi:hypothetical protein
MAVVIPYPRGLVMDFYEVLEHVTPGDNAVSR